MMYSIHVNGIDICYRQMGEGDPLVMVHGNGEDHTIFEEAAEELQKYFTCYLVDSRDHGESTKTEELHYEDMAEDMRQFMEELDMLDVTFYGFSDGGIVGLLAAAGNPRVNNLIVSGANLTPEGARPWLRAFLKVLCMFRKNDNKLKLMMNEPHISHELLKTISARTLVLAGSHDMVTEKETREIAENIPGAELRILKGEGHASYIVHSTKIAEIIKEFVYGKIRS